MKARFLVAAAALLLAGTPTLAQSPASTPGASAPAAPEASPKPKRTRKPKGEAKSAREPTANQMAARERQRKCSAEWKKAKAGGKTGGATWPKFWSQCNARLKGKTV